MLNLILFTVFLQFQILNRNIIILYTKKDLSLSKLKKHRTFWFSMN